MSGEFIDRFIEDADAIAKATEASFDAAIARHQIAKCVAPPEQSPAEMRASAAWHDETGNASALVSRRARFFDLVVLGRSDRVVDQFHSDVIEQTLVDLSNAQGDLERIRNTPLPKQYAQYPRLFVTAFCVLLPLGLVDSLLIYTPIASTLVGFMLMTMEKMGRDLQDPFSNDVHDVPMASICRTIQIDLLHCIGEKAPSPATSVEGVLW